MYYNPEYLNPLDNEVGRLIRCMPRVDTSLLLLMADAYPERGWAELSLGRPSDRIDLWEPTIPRFPECDQPWLPEHVADARDIYELRNIIVHGRWWPADNGTQEEFFLVEKVLTKSQTRRETGRADWPDGEYPAVHANEPRDSRQDPPARQTAPPLLRDEPRALGSTLR